MSVRFVRRDFAGHLKKGASFLSDLEKKFIDKYTPKVPSWLGTQHLTMLTFVWIGLIVYFSYLAKYNVNWMWVVSICISFQYLTDVFDGAVGRFRNTGLIKWGYYMDHFADYLFLSSMLTGYSFIVSDQNKYLLFFVLIVFTGFMVSSFLIFNVTNELEIVYFKFGPTEMRIMLILINTAIIFLGIQFVEKNVPPYIIFFPGLILLVSVYRRQRHIWQIDIEDKKRKSGKIS